MGLSKMPSSGFLLGALFTFTIGGVVFETRSALACSSGACAAACLSGDYAFSLTAEAGGQNETTIHRGLNGVLHFTPSTENGNQVTGRATLTADHQIMQACLPDTICRENVHFCQNGSYTIDSDCTGTLSLDFHLNECSSTPLGTPTWYFALEDGGQAFRFMATNGDMVGVGSARRQ